MNETIKMKWVQRLRSGRDRQGTSKLKNRQGELCCLGVLCEIAVKEGVIRPPAWDEVAYFYDGNDTLLPESVAEWGGLSNVNPIAEFAPVGYGLATLNDNGFTFEQIADVIEATL